MRIPINKGLDHPIGSQPFACLGETKPSVSSAFLGRDFPSTRLHVLVEKGGRVRSGQAVLCDSRRPDIVLTSPVTGTVSEVRLGARRSLISLKIVADAEQEVVDFKRPDLLDRDSIRSSMLASGLWATLRTRPFGIIPDPDQQPKGLFITAIDTQPFAPEPALVISKFNEKFRLGIEALCKLVDCPVYLCKSSHYEFELDDSSRATLAEFEGPHPAGLVGVHIHRLCPIGFDGKQVWHIGYQDVISLGQLIESAKPWFNRVISLAGSAVKNPRLIEVPLGTSITDITVDELLDQSAHIISGSILAGHPASGLEAFLGQRHHQVTAIIDQPGTATGNRAPGALIPTPNLDLVAPPGILAAPLLRALLVGDVDRALDLGVLELVEEDLALLSYTCSSGTDYGPLLRQQLDLINKEGLSNS
jgi:Na+-transporting NADH:ubiquinone oxidoreductase subunit A